MNQKPAVIIGIGPNDVEIPLVFCENLEKAKEYIKALGDAFEIEYETEGTETGNFCCHLKDVELFGDLDEDSPIFKHFFKDGRYYGGCGNCDYLEVREIDFNTPFVKWDLD